MLSGTRWDAQGVSVQRAWGLQAEPEEQQHQPSPAPAPPAPGKAGHPQPILHRVGLNSSASFPAEGSGLAVAVTGVDVMQAQGQVPGLLLGPILFSARGTLQRLAGRAADEKQTAAPSLSRRSTGSGELGLGVEG